MDKRHLTSTIVRFCLVSNEFIALWLHKGRIVFAFDCGEGKGEIESLNRFNDDQWHQIDVQRHENNATLFIDSHSQGFITPPGSLSFSFKNFCFSLI